MAFVIISMFLLLAWLFWLTRSTGPLRQGNAGARLFQEKRYTEAADAFRALLTHTLPAGREADTRRRLADTLDVLGQVEEATAEREQANAVSMSSGRDPLALETQGDLLRREHRYDEACEIYERSLRLISAIPSPRRAQVLAKMTLAHYGAGRSTETVRWAEASLAKRPDKTIRLVMHRMAGVGYSEQGELEKAEAHYLRALELAEAEGNPKEVARSLGTLATVQRKRGQFEDALATSRRAIQMFDDPERTALMVEAECLRDMGRFEESLSVMRQYREERQFDQPWGERRIQALGALGCALTQANAERPDAALVFLEEARAGLKAIANPSVWPPSPSGNDDRILLWCDATAARIQAQLGKADDARRMMDSVLSRLPGFSQDRATQMGTYGQLGRATLLLGDLAVSREFWRLYGDNRLSPVDLPTLHYHLGEIVLRLDEMEAARKEYRQAVVPGIDSFYARRAQARLDEMGG